MLQLMSCDRSDGTSSELIVSDCDNTLIDTFITGVHSAPGKGMLRHEKPKLNGLVSETQVSVEHCIVSQQVNSGSATVSCASLDWSPMIVTWDLRVSKIDFETETAQPGVGKVNWP
jgi:hypothetical protein